MTTEQLTNAEIYYSILKQKMHKSFSKNLKESLKQKEKEALTKVKQVDIVDDAKVQTSPVEMKHSGSSGVNSKRGSSKEGS